MRKTRLICMATLLQLLLTALQGCSSGDEGITVEDDWAAVGLTLTRDASMRDDATVVGQFERDGVRLRVIDITRRFTEADYWQRSIPVSHVPMELLPEAIKEKVYLWGMSGLTKLFRLEYNGNTYYDMSSLLSSSMFNIYDSEGNPFVSYDDLEKIKNEATASCILVLNVETIKNVDDAPNYLVGIWQNDWQHLMHDNIKADVALYPELPFSITEVMRLNDDGTGYLRTVKTYKDGQNEIALDPFRYELTDYHGGEQYGYHGYYYTCYFEAGDIIGYLERSYDGMQTMAPARYLAYYPWFKQTEDAFASEEVNAGQKYGVPAKDSNSPIVGRWTGGEYSEYLMRTISTTWVFRKDNTGYRLLDGQYNTPFAYTVNYNGSDAEVTIYKYNTGFTVDEGFAKNIADLSFDPTILPKGTTIKARLNGNSLELDGWGSFSRQE